MKCIPLTIRIPLLMIFTILFTGCTAARNGSAKNQYGLTGPELEQLLGAQKGEVRQKLSAADYDDFEEVAIENGFDPSFFDDIKTGILVKPRDLGAIRSAIYCEKIIPIGWLAHYRNSTELYFDEKDMLVGAYSILNSYGP